MLKLILFESVCILVGIVMGKPLLTQNRGISPAAADSEFNLVGASLLVIVAIVAAVSVAVGVVVRAGAGGVGEEYSDDDFEDITLTASGQQDDPISREGPILGINGKITRGKDMSWILVKEFDDAPQFYSSDLAKKIKKEFTAARKRQFQYAEVTEYRCKFARKKHYQPCPWKLRVLFLSHCQVVQVESTEHCQDHVHQVETDVNSTGNPSGNYLWTPEMNNFVEQCINNHGKPKVLMRNLEDAGCFVNYPRPSMPQLYNKIHAVKKALNCNPAVGDTFQLRQLINNYLEVPENTHHAYVPYYEILDDDPKNLRFTIIFSTQNCLARWVYIS